MQPSPATRGQRGVAVGADGVVLRQAVVLPLVDDGRERMQAGRHPLAHDEDVGHDAVLADRGRPRGTRSRSGSRRSPGRRRPGRTGRGPRARRPRSRRIASRFIRTGSTNIAATRPRCAAKAACEARPMSFGSTSTNCDPAEVLLPHAAQSLGEEVGAVVVAREGDEDRRHARPHGLVMPQGDLQGAAGRHRAGAHAEKHRVQRAHRRRADRRSRSFGRWPPRPVARRAA